MSFVVLPGSIPDIREIYDVYFAAFEGELVTQVLFPWDVLDEDFRNGHTKHTLDYWKQDNTQYTFKCVDTKTNRIIGMSLWDVHWKERGIEDRKSPSVDWLQGEQKHRAQNFIHAFWKRKEEVMGGRKHVYCHVVAVHPDYRRKGIGTMLMKPGIQVADQLQIPVYLEATDCSINLYQKLGFIRLDQGVALGSDVVGESKSIEAPIMIRMCV